MAASVIAPAPCASIGVVTQIPKSNKSSSCFLVTDAANSIKSYWGPLKILIMMIGGIVGLIGGLRIYNKWTNGDQDINKEILGWGGACLFLILVPIFVGAFFGLN